MLSLPHSFREVFLLSNEFKVVSEHLIIINDNDCRNYHHSVPQKYHQQQRLTKATFALWLIPEMILGLKDLKQKVLGL